jgi:monoamine oxidase
MIDELTRQLGALHQTEVPRPHTALYRNWSLDPFGAAWHYWNPHNRSWELMARLRRPVPDANLHVCGEAFSSNQGWVAGAVNTAERVLETHFGLRRPGWVSPTYSFGP